MLCIIVVNKRSKRINNRCNLGCSEDRTQESHLPYSTSTEESKKSVKDDKFRYMPFQHHITNRNLTYVLYCHPMFDIFELCSFQKLLPRIGACGVIASGLASNFYMTWMGQVKMEHYFHPHCVLM